MIRGQSIPEPPTFTTTIRIQHQQHAHTQVGPTPGKTYTLSAYDRGTIRSPTITPGFPYLQRDRARRITIFPSHDSFSIVSTTDRPLPHVAKRRNHSMTFVPRPWLAPFCGEMFRPRNPEVISSSDSGRFLEGGDERSTRGRYCSVH
jgi:hypothetical protein